MNYDQDTRYGHRRGASGRGSAFQNLLMLGLLLATGILVWKTFFSGKGTLLNPLAEPRAVTARGDLAEDEKSTIAIFKTASPSVVHITAVARRSQPYSRNILEIPQGTGTGFIWDENGYVVTNWHVLKEGNSWIVTLADQSTYNGVFVGGAREKDLAVLKIPDCPREKLRPILIGESARLEVGQKAYAIGNPFGLDQSLTTGVISGLDREIKTEEGFPIDGVIQTDAAINPGNSGGPLLDSAGRLIGVNTAIVSPSGAYAGIGFAIAVDGVNKIVPEIIRHGKTERPGLGVSLDSDSNVEAYRRRRWLPQGGALVKAIVPRGAAERAGLRGSSKTEFGDLIIGIDDQPVRSTDDLVKLLMQRKVGDEVKISFLRGGAQQSVVAKLSAQ